MLLSFFSCLSLSLSHSFFFFFSSSSSSLFIFFSFFLLTTPDDRYLISVSKSRGASFPSQVDARTFPKLFRLHHQSQRVARPGITRFRLNRLPCCVCIYIYIDFNFHSVEGEEEGGGDESLAKTKSSVLCT